MESAQLDLSMRTFWQWMLTPILIVIMGWGWKYPWLGYGMPIIISINILTAFLNRGKVVCGTFCPRGGVF